MSGPGLEAWVEARRAKALGRVRLAGLAVGLALLFAAGWLGWRETELAGLPGRTARAVDGQASGETLLGLKYFSLAAFLAKVRGNTMLNDVLGSNSIELACIQEPDLRRLPEHSDCRASWEDALSRAWRAAFFDKGPPLPDFLRADGWGSPLLLNLSEISCGHYGAWCPPDVIRSAGPDGKAGTPDDIQTAIPQHLGPSRVQQQ